MISRIHTLQFYLPLLLLLLSFHSLQVPWAFGFHLDPTVSWRRSSSIGLGIGKGTSIGQGSSPPQHLLRDKTPPSSQPTTTCTASVTSSTTATMTTSRRRLLLSNIVMIGIGATFSSSLQANAAPPIAVIAEELGYFPIQNKQGDVVYVPKRISRHSSEQAVELAKKLKEAGAVMYGAFWCPHCARQKELLGREAWQYITYIECSPQGYGSQPLICSKKGVDGYPTWIFKDKSSLGGERSLEELAEKVNFIGWKSDLEENVPPPMGSTACK